MKRIIILLLLFVISSNINVVSAEISISSSKDTTLNLKPGDVRELKFDFKNTIPVIAKASIYKSQYLTANNGGPSFIMPEDTPGGISSWLDFESKTIEFKPNEEKHFKAILNIPKEVKPGQYVIAIVAFTYDISKTDNKLVLEDKKIQTRGFNHLQLAKQIVINIGDTASHNISIDNFDYSYNEGGVPELSVNLTNSGTILEKPLTAIIVKDREGLTVLSKEYKNSQSFYGSSTQRVLLESDKFLDSGKYSAHITVKYSDLVVSRDFVFNVRKDDIVKSVKKMSKETVNGTGIKVGIDPKYIYGLSVLVIFLIIILFILIFSHKKEKKK